MKVIAGALGAIAVVLVLLGLFGDSHEREIEPVASPSGPEYSGPGLLELRWNAARYAYALREAEENRVVAFDSASAGSPKQGFDSVVSLLPETSASSAEIIRLACAPEYEWSCGWIISVIACESGGRPTVVGAEYTPSGTLHHFIGLLQIWEGHRWTEEELKVPAINIAAGYELWEAGGGSSWPNCP